MRPVFLLVCGFVLLVGVSVVYALPNDYNPASVGAGRPEVHIKQDGMMTMRGAKVDQIVGTTFFLQLKWGQLPMRFTMKTDTKTEVRKRYGGAAAVAQIKVGDYLDAEGDFFVGSDFFGLTAKNVKDWSLQEEREMFSGTIVEISPDATFTLRTPPGKIILVRPATPNQSSQNSDATGQATTTIRKGSVSIPWSRLMKGDTVPLANGVYDYAKNTLTAGELIIFQPKTAFAARNYEGVLKYIEVPRLPTSLTVTAEGADYTVRLTEKTAVQRKNRAPAEIARFVAGDTVRFYGALREEEKTLRDELIVDAEVVRNLNL